VDGSGAFQKAWWEKRKGKCAVACASGECREGAAALCLREGRSGY
jgi:hypothetical protein